VLEENNYQTVSRLSFHNKLKLHRSNRLNETFGQINTADSSSQLKDDETLVPLSQKILSNNCN